MPRESSAQNAAVERLLAAVNRGLARLLVGPLHTAVRAQLADLVEVALAALPVAPRPTGGIAGNGADRLVSTRTLTRTPFNGGRAGR